MNYRNFIDQLNTPTIPEQLRGDIVANGDEYFSDLVDILADESQWGADEDGEGCAAVNAAILLGEMQATNAITPMLAVLDEVEMDSELAMAVVDALSGMGDAVVEPVLKRNRDSAGLEVQFGFVEILARCGVRDERIFKALCRELTLDPAFGAAMLAEYGDPEGLPLIVRVLDETTLDQDEESGLAAIVVLELSTAIEALGGSLSPEQIAKSEEANAILAALPEVEEAAPEPAIDDSVFAPLSFKKREAPADAGHVHGPNCNHAPQTPHVHGEKVGPNEPCHCGSGKKYKKCHLFADERARFAGH